MDIFDRHELDQILASEGGPHVTIYLPAPERALEAKNDAIRITNLIRDAHSTLTQHWMPAAEADVFLNPLDDLSRDSKFLAGRRHGVAIYLSGDVFKVYRMSESTDERMVISRAFCLRPMLSSLHISTFFVLTLSKQRVSLYSATAESIAQVENVRLPTGFEQQMLDVTADRGAQLHSSGVGTAGKQAAVFHGQGGKADTEKAEITKYLRHVDEVVSACLHEQTGQSGFLIVAGVDYLTAIYEHISSCARLIGQTISGNVDHLSAEQLHEQAMPIARQELRREREADANRIREHRRNKVATDPEQVLCAAYEGRIDTLFFDSAATLSGSFYPDTRTLKELHHAPTGDPGDPSHDLIEVAVVHTLRHGGHVHRVPTKDMPAESDMAAALRY
jgi:hypothetical protein